VSYVIQSFGDLIVPPWLHAGDAQDIGTGGALTSFLQLPGGGYYDNYQSSISPQGIRPISKSGVFLGTPTELRQQLDAWRAMLGHRAKLSVLFDDGALRWQWARLQDVSTPRGVEVKRGWLPFALTWITAAQNWRGAVNEEWTWGDGTWDFGDGSAYYGVGKQVFSLTGSAATFTVNHGGSIDASNVKLRFDIMEAWQDLKIINQTTGQTIDIDRGSAIARPWVEIDSGARTVYLAQTTARTITAIYREMNRVWVITSLPHGLDTHAYYDLIGGQAFRIEGSGAYNGTYFPAITSYADLIPVTANKFYFIVPGDFPAYGGVSGGKMTGLYDIYDLVNVSDRKRWLVLAPGNNQINIAFTPIPSSPFHVTMTVEFTDHHA